MGACAVEMHFIISQEQLYTENYKKNAAAQLDHPDQALAFTTTIRTCQCGHTVWGKNPWDLRSHEELGLTKIESSLDGFLYL